jgi:hypothetical protein
MNYVDRYVQSVRTYLPRKQQDDIARELRENLLAKIEDKESELQRPLTPAEEEALLRAHGHPMLVASRYSREPHPYVIGPVVYPAYRLVLRVALPIVVLGQLVASVVMLLEGRSPLAAVGSFWGGAWLSVLFTLGVITVVFALIDRNQPALFAKWDPQKLPKLRKETRTVSRLASIAELAMISVAIAWWVSAPHYLGAIFEEGAIRFLRAGPGLLSLYLPFLLLMVATAVQPIVNLIHPHWIRFRLAARLVTSVLAALLFTASLKLGDWILLADPTDTSAEHLRLAAIANHWTRVGVEIAIAAIALRILVGLWKLSRERRREGTGSVTMSLPSTQ